LIIGFVVTPLTFFKMKNKISFDSIELCQPSFGETPEGFDAVDMDTFMSKRLGLVDPDVLVVPEGNQAIIGSPVVCDNDTVRAHLPGYDGKKCFRRSIWNDLGVDTSVPLVDPEHGLLPGCSATLGPAFTLGASPDTVGTEETFVGFNDPDEFLFFRHLMVVDQLPEDVVVPVDGVPVVLQ